MSLKKVKKVVVRILVLFSVVFALYFGLLLWSINEINSALNSEYPLGDSTSASIGELFERAETLAGENPDYLYPHYRAQMETTGIEEQILDRAAIGIQVFKFLHPSVCIVPFLDVTTLNAYAETNWGELFPGFEFVDGVVRPMDSSVAAEWLPPTPQEFAAQRLRMKNLCQSTGVSFYADFSLLLDHYRQSGDATIPMYTVSMKDSLDEWFWNRVNTYIGYFMTFWILAGGFFAICYIGWKAREIDY